MARLYQKATWSGKKTPPVFCMLVIAVLLSQPLAFTEEVLFITTPKESETSGIMLDSACRFYGLSSKNMVIDEGTAASDFRKISAFTTLSSVVITAHALSSLSEENMSSLYDTMQQREARVLITGITPESNPEMLSRWSGGVVTECRALPQEAREGILNVEEHRDITRHLSGFTFTVNLQGKKYVHVNPAQDYQPLLHIAASEEKKQYPIFLMISRNKGEYFFLTETQKAEIKEESTATDRKQFFLEALPYLMFLRYSCGERCWHRPVHYANLTIDDPWLRKSYGHLHFEKLVEEMKKVNFHTTIAFIPWNYDRSKTKTISLFRAYPDKLSLCVHGNNHDHREFYKYESEPGDLWPAKSLKEQESNIRQALDRMEAFRNLTGLPYDRVMVFPHSIAPENTLGLLKKYNFLATINENHVPLGKKPHRDPLFRLRKITMRFANFTSIKRDMPAHLSPSDIAMELFLDNPLLFFEHHSSFSEGIDAFNDTAQVVNSLEPAIEWKSLGYIVGHLYLQQIRSDDHYNVVAFSNHIVLENPHSRTIRYYIHKEESFNPPIQEVTVNGTTHPYDTTDNELRVTVAIPSEEMRTVVVKYENDLDSAHIDITRNDPRVNKLRRISDFRDITLSGNVLGRTFIQVYYGTALHKFGLKGLAVLMISVVVLFVVGCLIILRQWKKRRYMKTEKGI